MKFLLDNGWVYNPENQVYHWQHPSNKASWFTFSDAIAIQRTIQKTKWTQ